jgi:hypothetical protein
MAKRKARAQADPELMKQLRSAAASASPVEAVVMLRAGRPAKKGDDTDSRAKAVINRVANETGLTPNDVNVFTSLCSFVISADARFVEGLLDQPEVASVVANRRPDNDLAL